MTHLIGLPPLNKESPPPPLSPPPLATKATPTLKTTPLGGMVPATPWPAPRSTSRIDAAWRGSVRGVHWRKLGVVRVEYQDNHQLYEVACSLLFPFPEAAHAHVECVRRLKAKATPPSPAFGSA